MIECGRRRKSLPPPQRFLWQDLYAPRLDGSRVWLKLRPGEQMPAVLSAVEPTRVVWSSLWIDRPDDQVVLTVEAERDSSILEFVWLTPTTPPPVSIATSRAKRLSALLFGELRYTYGQ